MQLWNLRNTRPDLAARQQVLRLAGHKSRVDKIDKGLISIRLIQRHVEQQAGEHLIFLIDIADDPVLGSLVNEFGASVGQLRAADQLAKAPHISGQIKHRL